MNSDQVSRLLDGSPLFQGLPDTLRGALVESAEIIELDDAELVFRQEQSITGLVLVLEGELELSVKRKGQERAIWVARSGDAVGAITTVGYSQHFTTARCLGPTRLAIFPIDTFANLADRYTADLETLAQRINTRWENLRFALFLRFNPPFDQLEPELLGALEEHAELMLVERGQMLAQADDPADALYIVVDGRLRRWFRDGARGSVLFGEEGPGAIIGDVPLLGRRNYPADIRALRDTVVARLTRARLEVLLQRFPMQVTELLSQSLIGRLDRALSDTRPDNTSTTFALVPTSADVPITEFGAQLAHSIGAHGKTLHLTSRNCDVLLGEPGASQHKPGSSQARLLLNWLHRQEFEHEYTIYTADPGPTQWTRRCVRQADHVLFVAPAWGSPDVGRIEGQVLDEENLMGVRKSLVLLHPAETRIPTNTNAWLMRRRIAIHHHVRLGNADDCGRLGRMLVGRAVAVVMGGGGARGFAHIGIVRALREAGVPIDLLGGTSMGALIAAQCAMQSTPEQILDQTMGLVKAGERVTLPAVSLMSGRRMAEGIDALFGASHIEDLWNRYFSISCNLSRGETRVHDAGSLADAVLASNLPPGLLPPFVDGKDLLVDGGLVNNLPVDVMQRYNEGGLIIAVDVNPSEDLQTNVGPQRGLSGWSVMYRRLNPFLETAVIPSIFEILLRSTQIGGVAQYHRVKNIADLYLAPPVSQYSVSAHKLGPKISASAYGYALDLVTNWAQERGYLTTTEAE